MSYKQYKGSELVFLHFLMTFFICKQANSNHIPHSYESIQISGKNEKRLVDW